MGDEEDKLLPIANVGRIMKGILPAGAKISKEAKETMQECATEFISFVTGEGSDKCQKENRRTINGDDICWALASLGFDNYADAMLTYLHKLRDFERQKLVKAKQQQHQHHSSSSTTCTTNQSTNLIPFEFRFLDKGGGGGGGGGGDNSLN